MNEYKIVLEQVFKEIHDEELRSIDEEAKAGWEYSPWFEKEMNKLVKSQKHSYWKFINTAGKRIAIVALLVAVSFFCAMSVEASREAIIKFFQSIFNTHTEIVSYVDEDDVSYVPQYIENIYTIEQIPENFKKTYHYKDAGQVLTEWTSSDNKYCSLHQSISGNIHFYDTENTFMNKIEINGISVSTYSKKGYTTYVWSENDYIFTLFVSDEISNELANSAIGNLVKIN